MQLVDEFTIQLQKRLPTCEDDIGDACGVDSGWPLTLYGGRQRVRGAKLSATLTISSYKIGIAKVANRLSAVTFQPRPEITTGKSTEHGGTTCLGTLSLKCEK
jgi:hypothetical protein